MTTDSMRAEDNAKLFLGEAWSDPIEAAIRDRVRAFIEQLIEEELAVALGAATGSDDPPSESWPSAAVAVDAKAHGGYQVSQSVH